MTSLYLPICQQCDDMGDYTLATETVEGPMGQQPACQRHYDAAGERGAEMWSTEDVGAGERMDAAYRVDRELK